MENNTGNSGSDGEDSYDSENEVAKPEFAEGANYDSQLESGSESHPDFVEIGMRTTASSGLTMKEYEEQLKKLTAENFNLKLRVYFMEERLSKVTGISGKEDLIKKNIQLQVTCESQLKDLEKKQELLFEASKAFELLQKEHAEEIEKLLKEKNKEKTELEEKISNLQATLEELKSRFPNLENLNNPETELKSLEDYEKQINELESNLREEEERNRETEVLLKDTQLELESFLLKSQRLESELDQRAWKIEELVSELEAKEHDLASANFRVRKLEDELKSKEREEEILKERIEEKNKTIESLKNSLATRGDTIESLENRLAKERSASQTLQSKHDSLAFQNSRLKEELDILQSRLRRSTDSLSPRGKTRSPEDDVFKQKYEEALRLLEEQEALHEKRQKELEEKLAEKVAETEEYQDLFDKHKKLEDDHRKACTALKNFIKRSSEEKKEREALNQMLNSHEEVIADLKAQLDQYRSSMSRLVQDDKLSLAGTGDNNRKFGTTDDDKSNCCYEKDKEIQVALSKLESKEQLLKELERKLLSCTCGMEESMDKVSELEAEVIVLQQQLDEKYGGDDNSQEKDIERQFLVNELETKKCEIEKLNGDLKKRNINLQELVNKELWDKNRQIEKLEKRLANLTELNQNEIKSLKQKINLREQQLKILDDKLQEFNIPFNVHMILSDEGSDQKNVYFEDRMEELKEKLESIPERDYDIKTTICLQKECAKAREEVLKADAVRKEAAEVCSLLSMRLEELAAFLDSLLTNSELLNGIGIQKRQDIKQAMEKSRELSRHLSLSFAKKCFSDTSNLKSTLENSGVSLFFNDSTFSHNESLGVEISRDKVISEQTMIINRLREQLKLLNQEIKQRDIELSHCQGDLGNLDDDFKTELNAHGIESQTLSICQEISDDDNEEEEEEEDEEEEDDDENDEEEENVGGEEKVEPEEFKLPQNEKMCKKGFVPFVEEKANQNLGSHETSESEAWSEPDRSVSLARMGRLEDAPNNLTHRNSKCEDSSESSEETLNENSRTLEKRNRGSETEVRRLQARIKSLGEINENLRIEITSLRNGKQDSSSASKIQKNEEANLAEKLRKTMDRLEQCSLTCRQLEEKLAGALERASTSAMQLSKATETVSILEEEIAQLKEEIKTKTLEAEEKGKRIKELESKIEEMSMESELRIIEAIKQKEAAEKKTLEVECRLKDAENISKEVETRVTEIERKISETKKFKKETVLHFKEAEKHVDTAEKMMEEAEKIKLEAEKKSKDFQNFIDLMRKEVEEKLKEAEKRVKKSEREKEELERQVLKLKKRLMEAEKNKSEVEMKVKEGKETIQCMEEKLRELEVAMDQCSEEAQRKIKEMQKKADAKVMELQLKIEEREWARRTETDRKMAEAEKISRELEVGFKMQLEDAEKKVKKTKENAEFAIKKIQEEAKKQEAELLQKISQIEAEKREECEGLRQQLDEIKLEASEFELELTKVTNEKIYLEEELKRVLDKESALARDNKEIKGKYESSIHELEDKLNRLALNKSQLAARLEEIESTNFDLVSRISALRGKESMAVEHEFSSISPTYSPPHHGSLISTVFGDVDGCLPAEVNGNKQCARHGSGAPEAEEQMLGGLLMEPFSGHRRNMNSSPDLGIESDPGRFSSLEANQHLNVDQGGIVGNTENPEVRKLEYENAELRRRLVRTRQALEETLTQLSAANQRKKQVERAICKQLHKTHHILKKARVNFESQDGEPLE